MIEVNALHKKYDQRGIAGLHGIDLSIPKGEVFALLGPNGCGKSTLLSSIAGELATDSGSVKVSGKLHHFKFRNLPPDTNVQKYLVAQVAPEIDNEKKIQLTRDFADIFEFTFQLRQSCGDLSQGQRQKVMLTAELINNPAILLMDEPFAHLDPLTRESILHQLFTYVRNKEMSVVWVTHDREEAMRFADRMAVMQHGKLGQIGPCSDFLRPKKLFVAQFMGHKNFLIVHKQDGKWMTPWGPWHYEFEGMEAVLVVPIRSLSFGESAVVGKVESQWPAPEGHIIQVEWEGRQYYSSHAGPTDKTHWPMLANLSQSFLIPV